MHTATPSDERPQPSRKERSATTIVCFVLAGLFILAGLLLNEWVVARFFSADGILETPTRIKVYVLELFLIALGVGLLIYRARALLGLVVTGVLLLVVDNALYLACPHLPANIAKRLSRKSQLRYLKAHENSVPWVYAENIRFGRPNALVGPYQLDSLGYRNPPGYLAKCGHVDVLLLGDSFIFGTEDETVADLLRRGLAPLTVYSLGIGGDGIPQWRYHFRRFRSL